MKAANDSANSDQALVSWRVFCALDLPPKLHERIRQHINSLRQAWPDSKAGWSTPENVHLTLKFFGNVPRERVEKISAAAARAVTNFSPFALTIAGTGVFPKVNQPRVLWIGISDPDRNLNQMQKRLEDECAKEDFAREERAFRAHLTIARIRTPAGAKALAKAHQALNFDPMMIEVTELVVIRSELSSSGSKYTALSRHALMSEKL